MNTLSSERVRDGNRVMVTIFREMPPDIMCPMMIVPYVDTIALEGGYEPGTYVIEVNGFVVEIEL